MHEFDAKRLIAGVGCWVVSDGLALVDQIWRAGWMAMSFSCEDLRLVSRGVERRMALASVDTRIGHCREYSLHSSLSFPFVPGVLCFPSRLLLSMTGAVC